MVGGDIEDTRTVVMSLVVSVDYSRLTLAFFLSSIYINSRTVRYKLLYTFSFQKVYNNFLPSIKEMLSPLIIKPSLMAEL